MLSLPVCEWAVFAVANRTKSSSHAPVGQKPDLREVARLAGDDRERDVLSWSYFHCGVKVAGLSPSGFGIQNWSVVV